MRKCLRCQAEMKEGYDIKVNAHGYGIRITEPGVFGRRIDKPKAAICPQCGEISLYIEVREADKE